MKAHPEQREEIFAESKAAQAAKQEKEKAAASQTANVLGVRIGYKQRREAEAQGLRFDRHGRLLNP